MIRISMLLLLALLSRPVLCAGQEHPVSTVQLEEFFQTVLGPWDGEALETPIGPVAYDIRFHRCDDGASVGVADTGASLHYWRFVENNGKLHLRFLSTFAGNRDAVLLLPEEPEGITLRFFSPELELLTLAITPNPDQIDIRVYHYHKPHVHIRLVRSTRNRIPSKFSDNLCDRLPSSLMAN